MLARSFVRRLVASRLSHTDLDPLLSWDATVLNSTIDGEADAAAAHPGAVDRDGHVPLCSDRLVHVPKEGDEATYAVLMLQALPVWAREMLLADYVEHVAVTAVGPANVLRLYRECFL